MWSNVFQADCPANGPAEKQLQVAALDVSVSLGRALVALLLATGGMACGKTQHGASEAQAPPSRGFVIEGATLFDGERFKEGAVWVVDGKIEAVGSSVPAEAKRVDGRGHTLLPGLIDGHAHIGRDVSHLERFIGFGVTSVVDLFGPPELIVQLRQSDLAPEGLRRASLFGAGNLATAPGGHGTEYGVTIPTIASASEAGKFVAARQAEGSDLLKIVLDTSPDDPRTGPSMPTLAPEVVKALVDAGHARQMRVAVHTGGCDDIRRAVAAGSDLIAHGCAMKAGDDLPALLASTRVFFNPTLAVQLRPCGLEYWIPLVNDPELSPRLTDEERARLGADRHDHDSACSEGRLRLVGEAARAGARLVAGPDSPNRRIPVGASLLAEIMLLQWAGATVEQALSAATSNAADAYDLRDRGKLEPGLRADLLLVEGDLRKTPASITHTRRVWKAGTEVSLGAK